MRLRSLSTSSSIVGGLAVGQSVSGVNLTRGRPTRVWRLQTGMGEGASSSSYPFLLYLALGVGTAYLQLRVACLGRV